MEHLCAPVRRQQAGRRESLSDANSSGLISEAQKSASKTTELHARAARRDFERKDNRQLSQTFGNFQERMFTRGSALEGRAAGAGSEREPDAALHLPDVSRACWRAKRTRRQALLAPPPSAMSSHPRCQGRNSMVRHGARGPKRVPPPALCNDVCRCDGSRRAGRPRDRKRMPTAGSARS